MSMPGVNIEAQVNFTISALLAAALTPTVVELARSEHHLAAALVGVPVGGAVLVTLAIGGMSTTPERPLIGLSVFLGPLALIGLLTLVFGVIVLRCSMTVLGCLAGTPLAAGGVKYVLFDIPRSFALLVSGRLTSSAPLWITAAIAAALLGFSALPLGSAWLLAPPLWRVGLLVWMTVIAALGAGMALQVKENLEEYAAEYGEWIRR